MSEPDYSLGLWGELKRSVVYTGRLFWPKQKQWRSNSWWVGAFVLLWPLALLFAGLFSPIGYGIKKAPESACLQTVHVLGLAMYSYANDNNGNYPDGKSSTEVFQKLLDGGYVYDAKLFYIPAPGKVRPVPGQKLKPENVCFDVTSGVTVNSPADLPILFLTGYKITYAPGSSAVPIVKPYPSFGGEFRSWSDWWNDVWSMGNIGPGIAVFRVNNSAMWMNFTPQPNSDGSISNFIPSDFKPDGTTYRQLTPDGVLPP